MSSEHEALRSRTQRTLIDFLQTELKVGSTFVRTALLAKSERHLDHYAQAKQNAAKAAECVRRFTDLVADLTVKTEIGKQLAKLDRLISEL
jgi:hypothetical protein